ncbi:hypothetical protein [Peribacillus muralis]|uniref:hypothetical protein n=1 Tax=Peribacillus muralis TaxID=264697 RepID=UPI000A6C7BD0|nr:hypothetical protein [Peribacillus muralis]
MPSFELEVKSPKTTTPTISSPVSPISSIITIIIIIVMMMMIMIVIIVTIMIVIIMTSIVIICFNNNFVCTDNHSIGINIYVIVPIAITASSIVAVVIMVASITRHLNPLLFTHLP